jgi:acyl-CoA thioesterase-1
MRHQMNFVPEHALSRRWQAAFPRCADASRVALLALTLLLVTSFQSLADTPPGARIMVFGDSLSAAYGLHESEGWVSLMKQKVAPLGMTVINASISGETSTGGLSRIRTDLARNKPTLVVIALGANDGLRGLPTTDMQKNLQAMIDACRQAGATVVLSGIRIPPNYGIDYTRQFQQVYAELGSKNRLALVPFLLEGIADKLELFQADRLHPTAAAQPRILENVLPVVLKAAAAKPGAAKASAGARP